MDQYSTHPTRNHFGFPMPLRRGGQQCQEGGSLPHSPYHALQYPEQMKAYPLRRYQNSNNPYVMHEGHTIYRAEKDAEWT